MPTGNRRDYSNISVVIQGTPIPKRLSSPPPNSHPQKNLASPPTQYMSNSNSPFTTTMQGYAGALRGTAATATHRRDAQKIGPPRRKTPSALLWGWLRFIMLEVPLGLLFASLLSIYVIRNIYQDFYRPLFDRATRTDQDLGEEFTYYHRYCTEADLTTRNINDLVADTKAPVGQAVQQMMEHGGVVIRDLLSPDTVRSLREYVVYKNHNIPKEEIYPVSQGKNRISFGYDATESPVVVQALKELTNNPFLKKLLSEILGDDDPASSEITTITAYYGAPMQVWHSDTKEDGNALKFARTYSHSYSLFLPLQNTTKAMGMTDVCPGTHYCGNDLTEMCENTKMSLADADPTGPHFRAGDGALLNQIVWHRGTAHRDQNSLERIVLIVSFLARPNFQTDPRQLSRGTYFHQRWLMWGHTWKDLMDPMLSMQKPFSYLRCLSIWKPPTHSWGYDLVTSGFMRFANNQLEDEAISNSLWPRLDQLHFPEWLRSDLPDEYELGQKESWKFFLEGTMDRTLEFLQGIFWKSHALYAAGCLIVASLLLLVRRKPSDAFHAIVKPIFRLSAVHALALFSVFMIWHSIRSSPWGKAVLKGKALMRPFPKISLTWSDELALVSDGPTTFPANHDVLFGTRYDAKFLGMYEHYLNWHKGNKHYLKAIAQYAPFYASYQRLPPAFDARLLDSIIEPVVTTKGRFLQQDYRTGCWHIMSLDEIEIFIRRDLSFAASGAKSSLRQPLRRMIALGRFGFGRETALARKGVVYLHLIEQRLSGEPKELIKPEKKSPTNINLLPRRALDPPTSKAKLDFVPSHRLSPYSSESVGEDDEPFPVGCTVYLENGVDDGEIFWERGEVMHINDLGLYTVALESGVKRHMIPRKKMHEYSPRTEGDRVEGCFEEGLEDCFSGTVTQVMPDGSVSIEFDDGDFVSRHPDFMVYTEPFRYFPPER